MKPLHRGIPIITLLLAGAVCVLSLWQAAEHIHTVMQEVPFDHAIFTQVGHAFWQSGELYPRVTAPYPTFMPGAAVFKFPPMYQLAIAPWVRHSITDAYYHAAYLVVLTLYVIAVLLLVQQVNRPFFSVQRFSIDVALFPLLAITIASLYEPFYNSFMLLVGELPILFFCTVALTLLTTRSSFAGAIIATAACAKLYPAFLLLAVFLQPTHKQRLYFVTGFVAGAAFWCSLSIMLFGWQEHLYYWQHILPVLLQEKPMSLAGNLNIVFFLFPHGITHVMAEQVFHGIRLFLLAGCALMLFRYHRAAHHLNTPHHTVLAYSTLLTTMVLWLANTWIQYELLLLLPALVALQRCLAQRQPVLLICAALILLSLLSSDDLRDRLFNDALQDPALYTLVMNTPNPDWIFIATHTPIAWLTGVLHEYKPVAPYALWGLLGILFYQRTDTITT